jgi:hypothetical protein
LNGRPKNAAGLPASLAHPVFGDFIDALPQVLAQLELCWSRCPARVLCKGVPNLSSPLGASITCASLS